MPMNWVLTLMYAASSILELLAIGLVATNLVRAGVIWPGAPQRLVNALEPRNLTSPPLAWTVSVAAEALRDELRTSTADPQAQKRTDDALEGLQRVARDDFVGRRFWLGVVATACLIAGTAVGLSATVLWIWTSQ
jgi:hypothetical protein